MIEACGKSPSDTEEITPKESMFTVEPLLNKVSPENIGGQLPYFL